MRELRATEFSQLTADESLVNRLIRHTARLEQTFDSRRAKILVEIGNDFVTLRFIILTKEAEIRNVKGASNDTKPRNLSTINLTQLDINPLTTLKRPMR